MSNLKKLSKKTQQALLLFQQKNYAEAKPLLAEVCKKSLKFDLAGFLLATIYFTEDDLSQAQKYYQYTVRANPKHWEAYNNLGVTFEKIGNHAQALHHYKKAISLKSGYAVAYFHLGNLLSTNGEIEAAIENYQLALNSNPEHFPSLNNLALIFVEKDKYDDALTLLLRAEKIQAQDLEVLTNLGIILRKKEDYPAAIDRLSRALEIKPDFSPALEQLAISHQQNSDFDLALKYFVKAIDLHPEADDLHANYGHLLNELGDYAKAKAEFNTAIAQNEYNPQAWNGLGANAKLAGDIDKALVIFSDALHKFPSNLEIQFNLATSYLTTGDFNNGWKNYHARPSYFEHGGKTFAEELPRDLIGKTVFLEYDQGIGDELFFLRYLPELKKRGAKVIYFPHINSRTLMSQIDILDNIVHSREQALGAHFHILVGDLPYCLSNTTVPEPPPSLSINPSLLLLDEVTQKLNQLGPPPYIGLSWRAGQTSKNQLYKEIPLEKLAEIMQTLQGTFIALQRNPSENEIANLSSLSNKPITDFSDYNITLDKMTALLSILDHYIGVSNTNMHITAAVGKTARVLIPHPAEWRWMATGNFSPWFPGFAIYRQRKDKSWETVISQLKKDLQTSLESS